MAWSVVFCFVLLILPSSRRSTATISIDRFTASFCFRLNDQYQVYSNLRRVRFTLKTPTLWLTGLEFPLPVCATLTSIGSVRVKDGKSLRNGMWNGMRNGIIMRNTIYAGNKLTEERILFSRQFHKSSSFSTVADYYSQPRSRVNDIFEIWTEFWNLHVSFENRQRDFRVPV